MKALYIILYLILFEAPSDKETIPFEQIAFNYYLSELADKDLNGTLWTELLDFNESSFWFPRCLENFKIHDYNKVNSNVSGLSELVLSTEDKRLKIKPLKKGKYPKVYSTTSFGNNLNQHIVNIVEIYKHDGIIFHIEMDDEGNIIDWCKGGWIE